MNRSLCLPSSIEIGNVATCWEPSDLTQYAPPEVPTLHCHSTFPCDWVCFANVLINVARRDLVTAVGNYLKRESVLQLRNIWTLNKFSTWSCSVDVFWTVFPSPFFLSRLIPLPSTQFTHEHVLFAQTSTYFTKSLPNFAGDWALSSFFRSLLVERGCEHIMQTHWCNKHRQINAVINNTIFEWTWNGSVD